MKKILSFIIVVAMLATTAFALPVFAESDTVSKWDGNEYTLASDDTLDTLFSTDTSSGTTVYLLQSAQDVAKLAAWTNAGKLTWGKYFRLCCDIDIDNKAWQGIGTMANTYKSAGTTQDAWATISNAAAFQGEFDGDGHVIYNLNLGSNKTFSGFFNCITTNSAYIYDLGIASGNINVEGVSYLGALVGYMSNNAKIENCFNAADINSNATIRISRIGGLVGYVDRGATSSATAESTNLNMIYDSWNSGSITVSEASTAAHVRVGGIIGEKEYGGLVLKNCANVGNIVSNWTGSTASGFASIAGQTLSGQFVCSNVYAGGSMNVNYGDNITARYVGVAVGYNTLKMVIDSIYYDVEATVAGAALASVPMCGFDNQSNATTNFTVVDEIKIKRDGIISNSKAQNGNTTDTAGCIRFTSELSFSAGAFTETGYIVEFGGKSATLSGSVVYTSLIADSSPVYPTEGKYFIIYGVSGVSGVSGNITVTPYAVLLDGTYVYGASQSYTLANGVAQ